MMLERLYREALAEPAATAPNTQSQGAAASSEVAAGSARQQLANARLTLAGLKLRYKADHPDVVRTQLLIAELEPKAAAEASQSASADPMSASQPEAGVADSGRRESLRQMRAELESLDRQTAFKDSEERRVRAEIAEYQRRIEAVPGLESEWVALTRDYDTMQTAYKELLTKSSSAQMAANLEEQDIGERFRIVDEARVPVSPLASKRLQFNLMGLGLGLALGLGIAALLEIRDASYRSDSDVLEVLAMPVLASVPRVLTVREQRRGHRRMVLLSFMGTACLLAMGYVTWTLKLWKSLV